MLTDRRLILARPDLAAAGSEGVIAAERYVEPETLICVRPSAALRARADAASEQMTQLLFGERFDVLEEVDGWAFGQAARDRYVGWVEASALGAPVDPPTHWVSALRTYAFVEPNLKTAMAGLLSMNSLVTVEAIEGRFAKAAGIGWLFAGHLTPIGEYRDDPAAVALEYLGAPYQWGGRESLGLDCSAMVQNALNACGVTAPRDSDLQAIELGADIGNTALERGDLVFWKGHVGMMVDGEQMVHANGHFMNVTLEPLAPAIKRIAASGSGQPTGYRRIKRP